MSESTPQPEMDALARFQSTKPTRTFSMLRQRN